MPWKARSALDERREFLRSWREQEDSLSELCRRYGISRPTAYKLIDRYEREGEACLEERSRAPLHSPQAIGLEVADRVLALRGRHPRWGPRKLQAYLQVREPKLVVPAASTIGELLRREGLSHRRKKRVRTPLCSSPLSHALAPNDLWCTDFKGWFLCGDGQRCDPLTISDACSRFALRCRAVDETKEAQVRAVFHTVFDENGLPVGIRTDNGPPFASPAPGGLSRLSIWWVHLAIRHERIRPGCPQENGRHERLHDTLKQETASPPAASLRKQQEAFARFEREYNYERPHEALNYHTPAELYVPSPRIYPARLPEVEYPKDAILRHISASGDLKWRSQKTFLSKVLDGEIVGLIAQEEDFYEVYFGPVLLGWLEATGPVFVPDKGPPRSHRKHPAAQPER